MKEWRKTGCILCAQNCGLEILVEDGRMTKVRPDKDNPRSKGYACRKGMKILHYQYQNGRLTSPLKRVGERYEAISWDQATTEIAARMRDLVDTHGPRCLAYMGASSQGGHFEAAFGLTLLRSLGSQYLYSSAGQEFSGAWWVYGRMLGKQYNIAIPDEHETEMLVGWGWNGMQSHQMPEAPRVLTKIAGHPAKLLVIIDPRQSETARLANVHLALRPGTDALLMKAMIAIILQLGWENTQYLEHHVEGMAAIRPWFAGFDVEAAIAVCQLEYDQVVELCRLMTTRRWCMHPDLGIYMGRHSTLNSYLLNILGAVCGIFGVRGGNLIPGMVMPLGFHADERDPKTWRTIATNMPPAAAGSFPPAVVPEEILNDHPERLRALYISGCNPLRSYPDTTAYEKAFEKLDLLVVCDIVMSETARYAHYILPCRNPYESWDGTFFPWTYPGVYFQMRQPLVERAGGLPGGIADLYRPCRQAWLHPRYSRRGSGSRAGQPAAVRRQTDGMGGQGTGHPVEDAVHPGQDPGRGVEQRQQGGAVGPADDRAEIPAGKCSPGRIQAGTRSGGSPVSGGHRYAAGAVGRCGRHRQADGRDQHTFGENRGVYPGVGGGGKGPECRAGRGGSAPAGRIPPGPACRPSHEVQRQHPDAGSGVEQWRQGLHGGDAS